MSNSIVELEALPPSSRTHSPPRLESLGLFGLYSPSPDGTDTNLLILLHGLGDTPKPFFKLGQSLNLPQTAVLSLRGISQVPLLEEDAFQWFHSFDELGEVIQNINPTATMRKLHSLISDLTSTAQGAPAWPLSDIHFFGFAQGGTAAAELILSYPSQNLNFGSLVAVSSPLLSFPTNSKSSAKILVLVRRGEERSIPLGGYRKGFSNFSEVTLGLNRGGPSMLAKREEWDGVMRFWAGVLRQRSALEFGEDVYRVH